jgi:predicted Zn-dependent protease
MLVNYTQNYSFILDTRTAIHYALTEWQRCLNITFSETVRIEEADIKISFYSKKDGGLHPFDGPGNVLAHSYYPDSVLKGVINLDFEEDWYYNFLYSVLLHEIGHTFGIGHSSVQKAVMYPYYSGEFKKLDEDDCNAAGSLYGLKSKWGPISTTKTTTKTTTNSTYKRHYKISRDGKTISIYNSNVTIIS